MLRALLTAATGMEAQQLNLDTIANNLANAGTDGFKASKAHFQDLLYQTLRAPGQSSTSGTVIPGGIQVGSGVKLASVDKVFTEGAIKMTGNELDLMIEGPGFFEVQMKDGGHAFTRSGHFSKDSEGRVVTSEGYPLVPEIVIPQDASNFHVGYDGTVTVKIDNESQEIGKITLANFLNPSGLVSDGGNLSFPSKASGDPMINPPQEQGLGRIAQGQLESSNVNIISEMVALISGQRSYEIVSKAIQAGDQMLQTASGMR